MSKTKKMDKKLLAYYTQPGEVTYLATKHDMPIDDLREIIFSINNNGKPCRSIPKIEKAVAAFKQEKATPA